MSEEPATEAIHDLAEREARQRRFLETLLENATVCIAVVAGPELRYTLVNPAYQRLRPDLPLVGRTHPEALPEAVEAQAVLRRVMETGVPHEACGFRAPVPGKPDAAWDHRVVPLPVPEGEEPAVLVMAWDVTERERAMGALRESEARLRESEQRFKSMADTAPAMLWITDASHQTTFLSRGWHEFTGQTLEEGLGMSWTQAVFGEDRERVEHDFLDAAARRESFQIDYRLRRADGEQRWVVDSGRPRFDAEGLFLGYIGSVIDVHERKRAEQELQRLNAELSDESRRKDEFLATLAHELRNPLAPLRNSLELMKRAKDRPALMEKARSTMERQVNQMVRLVDDLLDVSRISRDRLELKRERVELASVVSDAVEICAPLCEGAGQTLSVTLPPEPISLFADPVRLAQVFGNLLTNACKYTEPGGRIRLSAERQGTDVVVTVEDNGVGIPPDMLSRVFDLFTQVDRSLKRSGGGLGIGLSLVKRLVEMHGGTVTARSEGPGCGSTFVVRLPALPEEPGPEPPESGCALRVS